MALEYARDWSRSHCLLPALEGLKKACADGICGDRNIVAVTTANAIR